MFSAAIIPCSHQARNPPLDGLVIEPIHGLETKRALADHETRDHTGVDTGRFADTVFGRLELTAIKRRSNLSAIAAEILDRNLPRLRIEQEG